MKQLLSNQPCISTFVTKKKSEHNIKQAEIKLAVAVICHCSVMAVENLNYVIKDHRFFLNIFFTLCFLM